MKLRWLPILLYVMVLSCTHRYTTVRTPIDLIPPSSTTVIRTNAFQDFDALLSKHPILNHWGTGTHDELETILHHITPNNDLYIALNDTLSRQTFTIVTEFHEQLISKDTLQYTGNTSNEKRNYKTRIFDKDTLYYNIADGYFVGSNTKTFVTGVLKQQFSSTLSTVLKTSDRSKLASMLFHHDSISGNILSKFDIPSEFSEHSLLNITPQTNGFQYNGITTAEDSLHLMHAFRNTIPQALQLPDILPEKTLTFKRIAFDDYTIFSQNLAKLTQITTDSIKNPMHYATEVGWASTEYGAILAITSIDIDLLKDVLVSAPSEEIYKDIMLYPYAYPDAFNAMLSPFIRFGNANYFCIIDTHVVFASTREILKSVISDTLNKNTLSESPKFQALIAPMSRESSYVIFYNSTSIHKAFGKTAPYNAATVQWSYDTNFAHINGNTINYSKPLKRHSVTESFSVRLPKAIRLSPQVVVNHITKAHDIIVQDDDHTLYLISNAGTVLWKKPLNGKILGEIAQIDSFKNGKLQLTFATKNGVYVIDRNGKDVGAFPLKLADAITQPLSVFDYENNKNYRLLVTQGNSLTMYDAKGKTVSGFKHNPVQNAIQTQPKHFRIARKDYIVFAQGTALEIIDRKGKIRIPVKDKIRFSNNAIYNYQNTFTTTNTLGELVQVDTKGKLQKKPLSLIQNHKLTTTSKTLVTQSDNTLTIRSRAVDLDYGEYTAPKLFYINDKIYVSTTDMQSNKVYLFDSQTKSIPNFPVFGMSAAVLINLDNDTNLELITQTDANTITVYQLN